MKRLLIKVGFLALIAALIGSMVYGAFYHPLKFTENNRVLQIPPGSSSNTIATRIHAANPDLPLWFTKIVTRAYSQKAVLKAGDYALKDGDTLWAILDRVASGEVLFGSITFIEGWTFKQIRNTLAGDERLKQTIGSMSDAEVGKKLGIETPYIEGWFFPATYKFAPGITDIELLQQALQKMEKELQTAWDNRSPEAQVLTPYDALILASIIEKETGLASDRARIGGVFNNRLKIGMLLQTDPTVIYGMKDEYQGNIRTRDLRNTENIWNTYVIPGLPPSPIAAPGRAALMAALQPEKHDYLYFVATGENGASAFAATLAEHNRNVQQYILKK